MAPATGVRKDTEAARLEGLSGRPPRACGPRKAMKTGLGWELPFSATWPELSRVLGPERQLQFHGGAGERATPQGDPFSPYRAGHAGFPASGFPETRCRRLAQAVARLPALTDAPAQSAGAARSSRLLPADERAVGWVVSDAARDDPERTRRSLRIVQLLRLLVQGLHRRAQVPIRRPLPFQVVVVAKLIFSVREISQA